jgi:hypothetical protein
MLDHAAVMFNKLSKDARIYPVQLSISLDMNFSLDLPLGLDSKGYHEDSRENMRDDRLVHSCFSLPVFI